MRLLLDTHTFLWFITNDSLLSATAEALIADPGNECVISPASYWEVAIRVNLGKYPLTVPFEQFLSEGIEGNDFSILPVEIRHAAVLSQLPMHHKDPFDRLIISQALADQIPVISVDTAFDRYGYPAVVRRLSSNDEFAHDTAHF